MSLGDTISLFLAGLAFVTAAVAYWQLREVRKRRRVDTYWKLFDVFTSDKIRASASAFDKIERRLLLPAPNGFVEAIPDDAERERLASEYWSTFYGAADGTPEKDLDRLARERLRFFAQTGVLARAKLVDRDLLFGLIGPALDVDRRLLDIIITAHRKFHRFERMYEEAYYVNAQYAHWQEARLEKPARSRGSPLPP
jgi:hypothetical protein